MKNVIIMIGLPGSSKSTNAEKERTAALADGKTVAIHSTDNYFMENGKYVFNPGKLGEYHARNFQAFTMSLVDGIDLVIVDNTNLLAEHRESYIRIAKALGYEVDCRVIGEFTDTACETYAARNTHGVPLASIKRMAARAELPQD